MKKINENKKKKSQGLIISILSLFIVSFVFFLSPLLPFAGASDLLVDQLLLICKILFAILLISIFTLIAADDLDKKLINFFYYLVLFSTTVSIFLLTYFL
jgi:hypothetical protein